MTPIRFTKPLLHLKGFTLTGHALLLTCERAGKTFSLKLDLRLAGSGIYSYHEESGTLFMARGAQGKCKADGEKFRDFLARPLGIFTASRADAQALLKLLWNEDSSLDEWPAEGVQPFPRAA